jgi:hypothetical protein
MAYSKSLGVDFDLARRRHFRRVLALAQARDRGNRAGYWLVVDGCFDTLSLLGTLPVSLTKEHANSRKASNTGNNARLVTLLTISIFILEKNGIN